MSSRIKRASQSGYRLDKVSIRELFESGDTLEPSEKALRARAELGILVFVESIGNTHYYDAMVSCIRANAARRCKGPGVQWRRVPEALRKTALTNERIIELLDDGRSVSEVTDMLVQELSASLNAR